MRNNGENFMLSLTPISASYALREYCDETRFSYLNDVSCSGTEDKLSECNHQSQELCIDCGEAAVLCTSKI